MLEKNSRDFFSPALVIAKPVIFCLLQFIIILRNDTSILVPGDIQDNHLI